MTEETAARTRQRAARWFAERHIYIRCDGAMRKVVLTRGRQMLGVAVVAGLGAWSVLATGGLALNAARLNAKEAEIARTKAASQRMVAEREARLNAARAELDATQGGVGALAQTVESRHRALALVVAEMEGEPPPPDTLAQGPAGDPVLRVQAVRADQERLLAQAEEVARTRAERLRLAFRMAGLSPSSYARSTAPVGGPLVEVDDPRALAAALDVDEAFARRVQRASADLAEMRSLSVAAERLPLRAPVGVGQRTSSFGVRLDPFTNRPAFHAGIDFGGVLMNPVAATAPGVVAFAGPRSGYGNTVEVDHGAGVKTRYAHLHRVFVSPGQRVSAGQGLGGMGATGRSTGVHLHYEVWVNGRVQNPDRFLKAGRQIAAAE